MQVCFPTQEKDRKRSAPRKTLSEWRMSRKKKNTEPEMAATACQSLISRRDPGVSAMLMKVGGLR